LRTEKLKELEVKGWAWKQLKVDVGKLDVERFEREKMKVSMLEG
jgi:hypothetical protein